MKLFIGYVNKKKICNFFKICIIFDEVYIIFYIFFLVLMLKVLSIVNFLIRFYFMFIIF